IANASPIGVMSAINGPTAPVGPLPVAAPDAGAMQQGSVALFDAKHGFGLITIDGPARPDVLVDLTGVVRRAMTGSVGDRVEFVREAATGGQKMPTATNVRVLATDA